MKKIAILWLDSERTRDHGYLGLLLDHSEFEITQVHSVDQFRQIAAPQFSLVVHNSTAGAYWELCAQLKIEHPNWFFLHVVSEQSLQKHPVVCSEEQQVFAPLQDRKRFMTVVKRLVRRQFHKTQKRKAISASQRLEKLQDSFDIRDVEGNLAICLGFLCAEFSCRNVLWFRAGELQNVLHRAWRRQKLTMPWDDHAETGVPAALSLLKLSERVVSEMTNRVGTGLPQHWQEETCPMSVNGEGGVSRGVTCVVPLCSQDVGEVVGHFVLLDAQALGSAQERKFLLRVHNRISHQMTQCLQYAAAKSLSYVDHLTQLYNQQYLPVVLEREIHRGQRHESPFALLFMQVDEFSSLRRQQGSLVGAGVLSELGEMMRDKVRESDYCFRYGRDGFCVLLTETDVAQAHKVAERMRSVIERKEFKISNSKLHVTVTIGVTAFPEQAQTKEQILSLADEAMYHEKAQRNIVYIAS